MANLRKIIFFFSRFLVQKQKKIKAKTKKEMEWFSNEMSRLSGCAVF